MNNTILGLHHITAVAMDAKRNYDFYTGVMGLRLVKKTVNFDDPRTYHLYFGNETGEPGTLITFFPWQNASTGKPGYGMATEINYAVPEGSLVFWADRFRSMGVEHEPFAECLGEQYLSFRDPDGLSSRLTVPATIEQRKPWETPEIKAGTAITGFHGVTITVKKIEATVEILTGILGYRLIEQHGNRYRFVNDAAEYAAALDIIEAPAAQKDILSAGTIHHIAFRVKNENVQMVLRTRIAAKGINITGRISRDYFYSFYFREPGGVLFEIATDNPGFAIDETVESFGRTLQLPSQYEADRISIEKALPLLY